MSTFIEFSKKLSTVENLVVELEKQMTTKDYFEKAVLFMTSQIELLTKRINALELTVANAGKLYFKFVLKCKCQLACYMAN